MQWQQANAAVRCDGSVLRKPDAFIPSDVRARIGPGPMMLCLFTDIDAVIGGIARIGRVAALSGVDFPIAGRCLLGNGLSPTT